MTAVENVIVMLLPFTSAVVTRAEKRMLRAPLVAEPFVTSASLVYVLPCVSAHDTVAVDGSIATATMMVFPAATPAAGMVAPIDVLLD
ncbi:MAG: hypothetical protein HY271_05295 [Deltaproteobacteria bacterium]|nr:hypothetical protein [Deltaproteobacteria bacterium]